jgi:hypothetical protein
MTRYELMIDAVSGPRGFPNTSESKDYEFT